MNQAVRISFLYSMAVAVSGMALLLFFSQSVVRLFIENPQTVAYGQTFLRIICLACPSTSVNFMIITIFQAAGLKRQPLLLSVLRKGVLDIPLMALFNLSFHAQGIAWATPCADWIDLLISLILFLPFYRKLTLREKAAAGA